MFVVVFFLLNIQQLWVDNSSIKIWAIIHGNSVYLIHALQIVLMLLFLKKCSVNWTEEKHFACTKQNASCVLITFLRLTMIKLTWFYLAIAQPWLVTLQASTDTNYMNAKLQIPLSHWLFARFLPSLFSSPSLFVVDWKQMAKSTRKTQTNLW